MPAGRLVSLGGGSDLAFLKDSALRLAFVPLGNRFIVARWGAEGACSPVKVWQALMSISRSHTQFHKGQIEASLQLVAL